ncbi:MAG: 16S rRNA (guanine(966)-N(2))-methyltransferase RsmD [Pseudolysinimonas sp.]
MTRIIAGFAGSLRLAVPPTGTRPTSDRVREAIFSALDARGILLASRVLDLYCGSGSLGLEAASRGAAQVTLVDNSKAAHRVTSANAALVLNAAPLGAAPEITVSSQPAQSFLAGTAGRWDVVFIDPPYDLGVAELVGNLEALVPRLSEDALVVVERSARDAVPAWPDGLTLERRKAYGDTAVYFLAPTPVTAGS